jgi:hypothetical protein
LRDQSSNGTYVTNDGAEEIVVRRGETPLFAPGCVSFGTSRRLTTEVLEFFLQ